MPRLQILERLTNERENLLAWIVQQSCFAFQIRSQPCESLGSFGRGERQPGFSPQAGLIRFRYLEHMQLLALAIDLASHGGILRKAGHQLPEVFIQLADSGFQIARGERWS